MSRLSISGRPLFVFCAVFFISTLIFAHTGMLSIPLSVIISACVLGICLPFFVRRRSRVRLIPIIICASVIISGAFTYFSIITGQASASTLDGATVKGRVTVLDIEYTSEQMSSYTVRFTDSDRAVKGKVSLVLSDRNVSRGDIFEGTFTLTLPPDDEKTEYYKNGIFLMAEPEEVTYEGSSDVFSLSSFLDDINNKLCDVLKESDGRGSLAAAVLLGDREGLDLSVKRDFSRLGIYHLLALSGLHLSVLVSALSGILDKTRLRPLSRNAIKVLSIILYMALTGFSVSVVRAGVMHVVAISASCIDRESDSFTSLSVAAVFILIADPMSAYDAGLLLSVLAAYGCITMSILKKNKPRRPRHLIAKALHSALDIFLLTLFINLITLPVTWVAFGELSLISPIVNVPFIPAVTLLLIESASALIFSSVPILSGALLSILHLTESVIIKAASAVSYLPGIVISLRHAGAGVLIVLLFLCLVPLAFSGFKLRRRLCALASVFGIGLILTLAIGSYTLGKTCDVQYTVIGRSDGFVLRDGKHYTVIDVSSGSRSAAYQSTDLVRKSKGSEIETLIITHYDVGHAASVPYMADHMIIRKAVLPAPENEDEADVYERLCKSLEERHVPVTTYRRDASGSYSSGLLSISFLPVRYFPDSSHPVVALHFTLGGASYAYGGGALSYAGSAFVCATENADTLFIGAHPPRGDEFFFPLIEGNIVAADTVMTDALRLKLSSASGITTVKNKEVYSTGTYAPK